MPTDMGPPPAPCASSSSCKRKQPDEDELLLKSGVLSEDPIENEYENLDDDEDDLDEDEAALSKTKAEYEAILTAQEPQTISQYDDIKITPFNLDEELEDGEFDRAGNFVFRRSSPTDDDKNDNWADSVDWSAVERKEREAAEKRQQQMEIDKKDSGEDKETEVIVRDRLTCYKQMLRLMRPDETVQKTIRRLGNEVPKRRPTNNKSKNQLGLSTDDTSDQAKVAESRKKLDSMIELAHFLLGDGDTDIYQRSYEDLEEAIN